MIGNDIVDLQVATEQSCWRRPRFLTKVLTNEERLNLYQADNPDICLWRLWTMKESAYKAYMRKEPIRFFNPKRLKCSLIDEQNGMVKVGSMTYQTRSYIDRHSIHTVAYTKQVSSFELSCFQINDTTYQGQHRETNKKVAEKVQTLLGCSKESLKIKKNAVGVPSLYILNTPLTNSISMSHHGKFGAFMLTNSL